MSTTGDNINNFFLVPKVFRVKLRVNGHTLSLRSVPEETQRTDEECQTVRKTEVSLAPFIKLTFEIKHGSQSQAGTRGTPHLLLRCNFTTWLKIILQVTDWKCLHRPDSTLACVSFTFLLRIQD